MKNKILELCTKVLEYIKKNKKIFILLVVILFTIIFISLIISKLNNNKIGNTTSNLYNKGMATIEDKYIYYAQTGNNSGIYKIRTNKEKTKKIAEGTACYLNLYKNYLYYIEIDEDLEINIIKIKTNGKEKERLVKNVDLNMITVTDDWVYYFENNLLYRIRTNGKDKMKVIEEKILNYTIKENYIYYIYNNGEKNVLARRTLDGKKFLRLSESVYENFNIIGNQIYYIEQKYNSEKYQYEYSLYKMKINGKNRKQLTTLPSEITNVNITKKTIYYVTKENSETYKLYEYKYKEEKPKLLKKLKVESQISVVNKFIYYTDLNDQGTKEIYRISV